jgi:large subunit ribosomal protein L24
MSRPRFHVKKGDQVEVITGNHKGAIGKVLQVFPAKHQVLIEGVRMIKKHTRKSQDNPQGAIIQREGPLHISNVKRIEAEEASSKTKKSAAKTEPKEKKEKKEKAS